MKCPVTSSSASFPEMLYSCASLHVRLGKIFFIASAKTSRKWSDDKIIGNSISGMKPDGEQMLMLFKSFICCGNGTPGLRSFHAFSDKSG